MVDRRDLTETKLQSELVYQGKFLKLRKDLARLPDGSTGSREYVVHPGAAAMIPLFDDGRILIERQFRYPLAQEFIEIPAGKIDAGESRIHPAIGFTDELIDIYLCKDLVKTEQQLDAGEFVEIEIVTLGWLMDQLKAGRLSDVKTQISTMWLDSFYSGRWDWPRFEQA